MKWAVPAELMTDDQQLDELLTRAADDWLHPGDIFDVARYSGFTDEQSYVEQAIHLDAASWLQQGLLAAGDLATDGYRPWAISPTDAAQQIATRWRSDHDAAPHAFFVWFEATTAGLRRAARVGDQRDDRG